MKYFVTGVAGFIGFHVAKRLLNAGHEVRGFDGLTPYYDPALKHARLADLSADPGFSWVEGMLEDRMSLDRALEGFEPDVIVHLGAQAGVRYSIEHPEAYIQSNIVGMANVLEVARALKPKHFLFASTSSAYGAAAKLPSSETDPSHFPVSLYAATKKSGEVMSHSYAHLFGIPTTCFRFFTVYGPWGRPDMAFFKFVDLIERGEPIHVYGEGRMSRDFTFIDDLVTGILLLADTPPELGSRVEAGGVEDSLSPVAPWRLVNIAGGKPVGLMDFIAAIEKHVGIRAQKVMMPMQPGDVTDTRADASLLKALTGYEPTTTVDEGVRAFVEWYRQYRELRRVR